MKVASWEFEGHVWEVAGQSPGLPWETMAPGTLLVSDEVVVVLEVVAVLLVVVVVAVHCSSNSY